MSEPLYPDDTGTLTAPQRRAFQELLRGPFVSSLKAPEIFATVSDSRKELASQLDNLFLDLVVDDQAGVAYTRARETDVPEQRSIVRTMSLTFMDTVVLLWLRHELVKTSPNERTLVDEDDAYEATVPYQPSRGTDHTAQRKQFTATWNKMKNNSIVNETPVAGRFEVSPLLRIVFSAEHVAQVERSYQDFLAEHTAESSQEEDDRV